MKFLSGHQRMGAAALILAASAFISRLMGLARDKIISWQFGASGEADMYFAAFVVPDIINYLLAGGFMSITIIPLLARGFENNETDTWKFFSCVLLWMTIFACLFTGMGIIWAESLARAVAPGFTPAQCSRLAFFMRIILPAQIFFLSGSCFTALLLLRRQFAAPALTPLIYNGFIIFCGILAPFIVESDENGNVGMTGYCVGVTIGAAIGAFALPFFVAKKDKITLSLVWMHPWIGKFLAIALPLMLGQTVVVLDEQFLRVFGSMLSEGNVSLLNYGRRIAQTPVGLIGQAAAMASYPFLVKLLAQNERERFDETLAKALNASLGLIIPCSVMMIAVALPILSVIFLGGRFGVKEAGDCAPLTQIMLASTPFWIIYMVLARAFYAHGDTITPALTGTVITLACIPCYYLVAVPAGAWAIAAVSGASVAAYVIWLMIIWAKRHGGGAFRGLGDVCGRALLCSLPAGLAAWAALRYLSHLEFDFSPFITACICFFFGCAAFGIVFIPLAWLMAPEIFRSMRRMVRRAG